MSLERDQTNNSTRGSLRLAPNVEDFEEHKRKLPRQFVNFTFYRARSEWRMLDDGEKAFCKEAFARTVDEFRPDEAAVEATFVNRDATATLKLGQARGIAMLVPAKAGVMVAEYAPNLVKKTIVGAGHSEKIQIRMMVKVLLPKADPQSEDAADALAIAVCHAHHRRSVLLKAVAG